MYCIREKINLKVYGGVFGILRTKIGMKVIEKFGKYKFWKKIGVYFIPICAFLGLYMMINIILFAINLLFGNIPKSAGKPIIFLFGNVIPWIPGLIALTIAITVHELAHGILARAYNINIKSTGLIFLLGIPLGAFVELDDKFKETNKKIRGIVASAGPMANLFIFVISILLLNISYNIPTEIKILNVYSPAKEYLKPGDIIYEINGIKINSFEDFKEVANKIEPNKIYNVKVIRDGKILSFNIKSSPEGKIGILVSPSGYLSYLLSTLYWTYYFNFLLALFNLLPAVPLDGFHVWNSLPELFRESKNKFIKRFGDILGWIINERTLNSFSMLIWWIIIGSIIYSMF